MDLANIPVSDTQWLTIGAQEFRRSTVRGIVYLWRKEHGEEFYAGYRITRVPETSPIAVQWVKDAQC